MRGHYNRQLIQNPYKISPFQQRSRLKSLKQLRQIPYEDISSQNKSLHQQQILQLLQKKLINDNQKQQNQQTIKQSKGTTVLNNPKDKNSSKFGSLNPKTPSKHSIKQQSFNRLQYLKNNNKLFLYFEELYKKEVPEDKVEREKVNFCQKQFEEIKMKVHSKLELNKLRILEMEKKLTKKYLQLHEYQSELKQLSTQIKLKTKTLALLDGQLKNSKLASSFFKLSGKQQPTQFLSSNSFSPQKKNLSNFTLKPPSIKQKHYLIEESISYIKSQITAIQEEIQLINTKGNQIEEQWVTFMILFINFGYYLINGSDKIIEELKNMKANLAQDDLLTELLDQNAKKYFITYFHNYHQNLKDKNSQKTFLSKQKKFQQRNRIQSNIEMTSLINHSNLKEIYSNTRQIMNNLLKKPSFRSSPQGKQVNQKQKPGSLFPKIQKLSVSKPLRTNASNQTGSNSLQKTEKSHSLSLQQQKQREINRINHIYFSSQDSLMLQKGKHLKRILFGFSVK